LLKKTQIQAYPDGMVSLYSTKNVAPKGGKPILQLTLRCKLPYEQKTVGAIRYYQGLQADTRIDNKLRVPLHKDVLTEDMAITHDGTLYTIRQVQYPEDVTPPSMDLSLERRTTTDDLIRI